MANLDTDKVNDSVLLNANAWITGNRVGTPPVTVLATIANSLKLSTKTKKPFYLDLIGMISLAITGSPVISLRVASLLIPSEKKT